MKASEQTATLAKALAAAQGEMGHASKDAENPHFRSHYATLASVVDAVRAPLAKHGIAFLQGLEADGAVVRCTTRLAHASGEWIESTLTMAAQNASPQSLASATTYARRYGLAALTGIAPADDDGEEAQPRAAPRTEAPKAEAPKPKKPIQEAVFPDWHPCPACGCDLIDNRKQNAANSKIPAWKCSDPKCTGGKDGKYPWASWRANQFDPPAEDVPPVEAYT